MNYNLSLNQRGLTGFGFLVFCLMILALGVYFAGGIYQSLIGLNIGDPIFFQILGFMMLLLAVIALMR